MNNQTNNQVDIEKIKAEAKAEAMAEAKAEIEKYKNKVGKLKSKYEPTEDDKKKDELRLKLMPETIVEREGGKDKFVYRRNKAIFGFGLEDYLNNAFDYYNAHKTINKKI